MMTVNFKSLTEILESIGIDMEMNEAVVDFGDWTFGDTDIVLVKSATVKKTLIDFVEAGMLEEYSDENIMFLDEDEMKHMIKDVFDSIPKEYYVDISG